MMGYSAPAMICSLPTTVRTSVIFLVTHLFFIFVPNAAFTQIVSFSLPTFFDVGAGIFPDPFSVAMGDFNGDGKVDLVVANFGEDSVSILLGNGAGLFKRPVNLSVGDGPGSVVVGDFNHDSISDIATSNEFDNSVSIILGTAGGTFAAATSVGVGTTPQSVAVGLFNNDAHPDLAVANFDSDNVTILLGNGAGLFSSAGNFSAGDEPMSVAVGDFNSDNKLDLAVANYRGGSVSILLGDGMGSFGAPTTFSVGDGSPTLALPRSVAVGDFNGDNHLDLAVGDVNLRRAVVLLGDGMGSFNPPIPLAAGKEATSVRAVDVNADGLLDLVVTDRPNARVAVLLGTGLGSFAASQDFLTGDGPWGLAVGDLDGDDKPDLAVSNTNGTGNITVLFNTGGTDNTGTLVHCPTDSLQAAIDAALPGERLLISGTCSGGVIVRNDRARLTLDGNGVGEILGASLSNPALSVRGKGILIQRLRIQGGAHGIHVNRGANAVIHNNHIHNISGSGIVVDQMSFAVITSNYIRNSEFGVIVTDTSTVRMGFNQDSDTIASPNRIEENGIGVVISNGSSARMVGNTIYRNNGDGVQTSRDSHADIADNNISWNFGDGIEIKDNAFVQLGEDQGTTIYDLPNTTSAENSGLGIRCSFGAGADGRQGSLTGFGGAATFFATCINSLVP